MISIDDFKKVDIVVGQILAAEKVPETDKLLKLSVDFGPSLSKTPENVEQKDIRTIVSGIAPYFPDHNVLVGKKCMFVANLEPRMIRGIESNGMILAVSTADPRSAGGSGEASGKFSLLLPSSDIPSGTRAR